MRARETAVIWVPRAAVMLPLVLPFALMAVLIANRFGSPAAAVDLGLTIPFDLLLRSGIEALLAGGLALLLGYPFARLVERRLLGVGGAMERLAQRALIALAVVLVVTPGFILAQGWLELAAQLGAPTFFVSTFFNLEPSAPLNGAFGVVMAAGLRHWPIAGALLAVAMLTDRADEARHDVERVMRLSLPWRARLGAPRVVPIAALALLLTAWLTFLDSGVAPLLGERAYAQQVWFAYRGPLGVTSALLVALPPIAIVVALLPLLGRAWRRFASDLGEIARHRRTIAASVGTQSSPRAGLATACATLLLLIASLGAPLQALATSQHRPIPWEQVWRDTLPRLLVTLGIASLAALVALGVASMVVAALWRVPLRGSRSLALARGFALTLAVLAFACPPHAFAFAFREVGPEGSLGLWPANPSSDVRGWFELLRVVIVSGLRLTIVPLVAMTWAVSRARRDTIEAAVTLGLSYTRATWLATGRRVAVAAWVSLLVTALLAFAGREVEEATPPLGYTIPAALAPGDAGNAAGMATVSESLTPHLFMLLHYGYKADVLGAIVLTMATLVVLVVLADVCIAVGRRLVG